MYRCAEKSLGRPGLVENGVRLLSAAGSGGRRTWGRGVGEYRPGDGGLPAWGPGSAGLRGQVSGRTGRRTGVLSVAL